jgi:hypothetical protein
VSTIPLTRIKLCPKIWADSNRAREMVTEWRWLNG